MRSRCVSVTGATGFLGRHIVEVFGRSGWAVRAVVRAGSPHDTPAGATRCEVSLHDVPALSSALAGSDVIVHAAGLVRGRGARVFDDVNVAGTRAVVMAANAVGARLVHISSLAAMGPGTIERPVTEDDAPRPVNAYGRSKLGGEDVVRNAARVPWIVLRPSAVYGPGDRGLLPLIRLARFGVFPVAAAPSTPFTFVYIDDLTHAVRIAAESGMSGEALFVGHQTPVRADAVLRTIATALGRRYRPLPVPRVALQVAAFAGELVWVLGGTPLVDFSRVAELTSAGFVCDVARARARLGYAATVAFPEGLARTVHWYREVGWI